MQKKDRKTEELIFWYYTCCRAGSGVQFDQYMRYIWSSGGRCRIERKAGLKDGLQAGKKEQALATARRMLASGKYGLDEISDISGLTVQDIQALSANP